MDINMPVMDGHKATTHIRERGLHLPIIAMTAYALKGDMELCLQKGMNDYIAKPVKKVALLKMMLKWLTPSSCPKMTSIAPDEEIGSPTVQSQASRI